MATNKKKVKKFRATIAKNGGKILRDYLGTTPLTDEEREEFIEGFKMGIGITVASWYEYENNEPFDLSEAALEGEIFLVGIQSDEWKEKMRNHSSN